MHVILTEYSQKNYEYVKSQAFEASFQNQKLNQRGQAQMIGQLSKSRKSGNLSLNLEASFSDIYTLASALEFRSS